MATMTAPSTLERQTLSGIADSHIRAAPACCRISSITAGDDGLRTGSMSLGDARCLRLRHCRSLRPIGGVGDPAQCRPMCREETGEQRSDDRRLRDRRSVEARRSPRHVRQLATPATAARTSSSAGRTAACSRSPASVSRTLRVVRCTSVTPSRSSSRRRRLAHRRVAQANARPGGIDAHQPHRVAYKKLVRA